MEDVEEFFTRPREQHTTVVKQDGLFRIIQTMLPDPPPAKVCTLDLRSLVRCSLLRPIRKHTLAPSD